VIKAYVAMLELVAALIKLLILSASMYLPGKRRANQRIPIVVELGSLSTKAGMSLLLVLQERLCRMRLSRCDHSDGTYCFAQLTKQEIAIDSSEQAHYLRNYHQAPPTNCEVENIIKNG